MPCSVKTLLPGVLVSRSCLGLAVVIWPITSVFPVPVSFLNCCPAEKVFTAENVLVPENVFPTEKVLDPVKLLAPVNVLLLEKKLGKFCKATLATSLKSAVDIVLKVGTAVPEVGPANTVWLDCVLREPDKVPLDVIGEPDTVNTLAGRARPTEITPEPDGKTVVGAKMGTITVLVAGAVVKVTVQFPDTYWKP